MNLKQNATKLVAVGVGSLLPAEGADGGAEPPVVLNPPLATSSLLLLLIFHGRYFGGLSLHFTSSSKRSVNFTSSESAWER